LVLSCLALFCVVATSVDHGDSPAASPYTPTETYSNILRYSHLIAMSIDTVHVYAGLGAAGPVLAYAGRAPSSGTSALTSGEDVPEETREAPGGDPVPSRAADGGISISLSRSELIEAEPGRIITARFMVTNTTGGEAALHEVVTYPPDWSRVASAEPAFTLAGGASAVRLVTFHVPPNCPAGIYDFLYEVMDPVAPALGGETSFRVTVLPQLDLGSTVMRAPRTAVAGTEFMIEVSFKNTGNTRAVATVRASARPDYEVTVEPVDIFIPSGASKIVRIGVKTDSHLTQKRMCMVTVEATVSDEEGQSTAIREVYTVEVIPRVTRLSDPYYRLPSRVKMTFAADRENAAIQAEVSGSGSIGGDKYRNLSYAVRKASRSTIGRYATWDEYWLAYRGRNIEISLGDRVFMLSPLVQRFYYGRGGGVNAKVRNVALGAYYAKGRSQEPRHREAGGFVSWRVKRGLSVKANVLEKEDASSLSGISSRHLIASIQGNYAPGPNARFELEYGVGDEEGSGNDGYRFAANGVFRNRLFFSLEKVHAGPRFYGYTTDSDFALGTLQYPVKPGVTLRLSYRSHADNLDLDPLKLTASNERHVTAGVSYIATPRTRVNIDIQDFSRWDRFDVPEYDFGERTVRLSVGYSVPVFSLYLSGEHGYSHNDLVDLRTNLGRYSVSASIRPSSRHSYNIYGGFGNNRYSEVPRKSDNLGIAGRWHVTPDLHMNLDYYMSGSPSLVEKTYRILTHSLDYMLPNRHFVTLKTSLWGGRDGRRGDAAVLLSYSIPAPIPLGRKKTLGTIKGRVYDAEDERHMGIADVIITADDQAAVTDGKGKFEFPSLAPGVYSLQVDARSIGLGRVTEARSPFVVVVTGGKTAELDIGVVRSCTISGEVLMHDCEPDGASGVDKSSDPVLVGLGKGRGMPAEARGLPDVLVEIANGEYYLTQYTSSGGEFSFAGLRPGHWTVRIYPDDLPHYYFVETEDTPVDLTAGDETRLVLRILPRQRRINIMDEGELKLERR
jgi:hypothetical protein